MSKYEVIVTETLEKVIKVKADSADDAIENVRVSYKNEDIVLDNSDYIDTEFSLYDND